MLEHLVQVPEHLVQVPEHLVQVLEHLVRVVGKSSRVLELLIRIYSKPWRIKLRQSSSMSQPKGEGQRESHE